MQNRSLTILGVLTVLIGGVALVSMETRPEFTVTPEGDGSVLPLAMARPDQIAAIQLLGGGKGATLRRAGEKWVVDEKDGYVADQGRVGRLLLGLARLRLAEAKTDRPDLWARLGVEDPTGPDAKSVLVRLYDGRGGSLGEIVVGRVRPDRLGGGNDGTYVRRTGEQRAWLAEGAVEAAADPGVWLDHHIVDLPAVRFNRITVSQSGEAQLVLERTEAGDEFRLADAQPSEKYVRPYRRSDLAAALTGLDLTDVRLARTFVMPAEHVTVEWRSFDGLVITGELAEIAGVPWLKLATSGEGATATEAARLAAAWSPWIFALRDGTATTLRLKRSDILDTAKAP